MAEREKSQLRTREEYDKAVHSQRKEDPRKRKLYYIPPYDVFIKDQSFDRHRLENGHGHVHYSGSLASLGIGGPGAPVPPQRTKGNSDPQVRAGDWVCLRMVYDYDNNDGRVCPNHLHGSK